MSTSIPRSVRTQVREFLKSLSRTLPPAPSREQEFYFTSVGTLRSAYWNMVDEDHLVEAARAAGIRVESAAAGIARRALIADSYVIKFSKDYFDLHRLIDEAEFIAEMRGDRYTGKHFPETHVVEVRGIPVLVQEKIDMDHTGVSIDTMTEIERLGRTLGIDDLHHGNYGWRGTGPDRVPVFIDVDYRSDPWDEDDDGLDSDCCDDPSCDC